MPVVFACLVAGLHGSTGRSKAVLSLLNAEDGFDPLLAAVGGGEPEPEPAEQSETPSQVVLLAPQAPSPSQQQEQQEQQQQQQLIKPAGAGSEPVRLLHIKQPLSCSRMGLGLTHQRLNLECALTLAELTGRKLLPYKLLESQAHTHCPPNRTLPAWSDLFELQGTAYAGASTRGASRSSGESASVASSSSASGADAEHTALLATLGVDSLATAKPAGVRQAELSAAPELLRELRSAQEQLAVLTLSANHSRFCNFYQACVDLPPVRRGGARHCARLTRGTPNTPHTLRARPYPNASTRSARIPPRACILHSHMHMHMSCTCTCTTCTCARPLAPPFL